MYGTKNRTIYRNTHTHTSLAHKLNKKSLFAAFCCVVLCAVLYLLPACRVEYSSFYLVFFSRHCTYVHILFRCGIRIHKNNVLCSVLCFFFHFVWALALSRFLSPFRCLSVYWCMVVSSVPEYALRRACLCEWARADTQWYFFDICWYHWTAGRQEKTAIKFIQIHMWQTLMVTHLQRKCVCLCGWLMCVRWCCCFCISTISTVWN